MSKTISAKNSFNAGDLISVLPGLRSLYYLTKQKTRLFQRIGFPADYGNNIGHPIKDDSGRQVCMNKAQFELLAPLIRHQEYIESFEEWNGEEVDINLDLTRQNSLMPLPGGDIHAWATLIFPQLQTNLAEPWLSVPKNKEAKLLVEDAMLVTRTARYRNDYITYHFLKKYGSRVMFVGLEDEYEMFCKENDLTISHLVVSDFLELATYIEYCKVFVSNQTFAFHVADALKTPRTVEICPSYPNTFPSGANGHSFITQGALEWQVELLFNK